MLAHIKNHDDPTYTNLVMSPPPGTIYDTQGMTILIEELERAGLIQQDENEVFSLTQPGIDALNKYREELQKENEQNEIRRKKEEQVLDLKIDTLVGQILDDPKMKKRLRRAEWFAGISTLAALITLRS